MWWMLMGCAVPSLFSGYWRFDEPPGDLDGCVEDCEPVLDAEYAAAARWLEDCGCPIELPIEIRASEQRVPGHAYETEGGWNRVWWTRSSGGALGELLLYVFPEGTDLESVSVDEAEKQMLVHEIDKPPKARPVDTDTEPDTDTDCNFADCPAEDDGGEYCCPPEGDCYWKAGGRAFRDREDYEDHCGL